MSEYKMPAQIYKEPVPVVPPLIDGLSVENYEVLVSGLEDRIAELEAALRLCVGALDRWQGAAPLSEAQVQARYVLKITQGSIPKTVIQRRNRGCGYRWITHFPIQSVKQSSVTDICP